MNIPHSQPKAITLKQALKDLKARVLEHQKKIDLGTEHGKRIRTDRDKASQMNTKLQTELEAVQQKIQLNQIRIGVIQSASDQWEKSQIDLRSELTHLQQHVTRKQKEEEEQALKDEKEQALNAKQENQLQQSRLANEQKQRKTNRQESKCEDQQDGERKEDHNTKERKQTPTPPPNDPTAKEVWECSVCYASNDARLEDDSTWYDTSVALACFHSFHTECINKWINQKKDTCPNCRHAIVKA